MASNRSHPIHDRFKEKIRTTEEQKANEVDRMKAERQRDAVNLGRVALSSSTDDSSEADTTEKGRINKSSTMPPTPPHSPEVSKAEIRDTRSSTAGISETLAEVLYRIMNLTTKIESLKIEIRSLRDERSIEVEQQIAASSQSGRFREHSSQVKNLEAMIREREEKLKDYEKDLDCAKLEERRAREQAEMIDSKHKIEIKRLRDELENQEVSLRELQNEVETLKELQRSKQAELDFHLTKEAELEKRMKKTERAPNVKNPEMGVYRKTESSTQYWQTVKGK